MDFEMGAAERGRSPRRMPATHPGPLLNPKHARVDDAGAELGPEALSVINHTQQQAIVPPCEPDSHGRPAGVPYRWSCTSACSRNRPAAMSRRKVSSSRKW